MEIVRKALAAYGSLPAYAAEGVVREDMIVDGQPQVVETRFSIRLGRPDSYRILWRKTLKGQDRDGVVWKAKGRPRVRLDKVAFEAGDDLEALRSTSGNSAQATVTIPSLFFPALESESTLRKLAGFELLGTEAVGGEECYRIAGASPQGDRTELWISKARLLVLQVRTTSRLHEQELAVMQGRGKTVTELHSDIRTEGGLTAADFAYELPEGVVQERQAQQVPKVPEFDLSRVRDVLAAPVRLFDEGYEVERKHVMDTLAGLLEGSKRLDGVERSAIVDILPGPGEPLQRILLRPHDMLRLIGMGEVRGVPRVVSPSYFGTLGLGVVDGRPLTEEDHGDSKKVAVINMTLARQLWVGDSFVLPDSHHMDDWEIVGVVEDGPEAQGVPEVYIPYAQAPLPPSVFVLVRTEVPPRVVADRLHGFLKVGDLPYGDVVNLEAVLAGPPAP